MLRWLVCLCISLSAFAGITPEAIELWKKRDDKASLEKAVQILEGQPKDLETLTYLTRGNFLLGEMYTNKDSEKLKVFEKARKFGDEGLSLNEEYKKLKDKDIKKAIDALTMKEIDVLYWAAASLGKWAKVNGVMSSLKYKDQILAMIGKVEQLNPNYFYGAVDRYMGGFYAIAPGIAGGDMKKSRKRFEAAMKKAPENLGTKVFYAEVYLTEEGEEKEFERVLKEVIAAPNGPEEIAPENIMEKRKAEELLKKKDKLF
ncbi:MAG: TRAP transporter TatT component family protein [Bacteriovoracaceae bacterium]